MRSPDLVDAIAGCAAVVHAVVPDVPGEPVAGRAAGEHRGDALERLVDGARTVVTAAAAANVPRVVLVTSAMVYGASADNPVPLDEDAEPRAVADGPAIGALLEVEETAREGARRPPGAARHGRPARRVLVGPGVDSLFTRHFEAPRLLVVKDSSPHWQFCHVDDLVSALELAAVGAVEGAVTVGCDGYLTQDEVEEVTGMRRIELPGPHRVRHGRAAAPARHDAGAGERAGVHRRALGGPEHAAARGRLAARVRQPGGAGRAGRGAGAPAGDRTAAGAGRHAGRGRCDRRGAGHGCRGPPDPPAQRRRRLGSGHGCDRVRLAELRAGPLSVDEVLAAVAGPAVGGTAVFVGTVRDHDCGREVHDAGVHARTHGAGAAASRSPSGPRRRTTTSWSRRSTGSASSRSGDLAVVVAAAAPHRADGLRGRRAG